MLKERFGMKDLSSIDNGARNANPISVFSGEMKTRINPIRDIGKRRR